MVKFQFLVHFPVRPLSHPGVSSLILVLSLIRDWSFRFYHHITYILLLLFTQRFSHHWSLSDSKSPQISRTLLSILAVLNNVVVWVVSTRPPTSKSSSPFSKPLVTVPNAPIKIGIIITCKVKVLILVLTFLQFYSVLSRDSIVDNFASSLLFVDYHYYYYCLQQVTIDAVSLLELIPFVCVQLTQRCCLPWPNAVVCKIFFIPYFLSFFCFSFSNFISFLICSLLQVLFLIGS